MSIFISQIGTYLQIFAYTYTKFERQEALLKGQVGCLKEVT